MDAGMEDFGSQIVIDRRVGIKVGIGLAIFIAVQLFLGGYTWATYEKRISALESDAPMLKQLNDRTIRMEVELGFIRKAVESQRR